VDSTYTDYLPSLNLRYRAADGLNLRAAASKTITRPNFNELSPSLTLTPNPLTPANNSGAAGNPDLKPVRSENLDLALEKYGANGMALTATAFLKRVEGFVSNVGQPETHDGAVYQVTRPQNGPGARIKGVELGYQQFFDFLPPALRGLGLQANYTFIDSETPHVTLGNIPLANLSRNSANLIGIYENEPISARLAGNWRSKFVSGFSSVVGATRPVYTRAYGWLDASLTYRVGKHASLAFEGSNLLRTVRSAYYGVETRPQGAWLNDRQFSASLTLRY
jgi:iron complex outermembrane recepter protein